MSVPAVADRISSLQRNLEVLKDTLGSAQERYKKAADKFRKPAPMYKPAVPNPFPGRTSAPPDPVLVDGQEEFIVERILDSRVHRRRLQYLVKWQGYSAEENSWEPVENVHAPHLIRLFHSRYPNKPDLRSSRGRLLRGE
ncbi:chromobox protein homolog 2-like [Dendrobates tinctorius]|uniref:chromobox protein homolog 2-like n=1 Tax=Dendrobates tinctorius TaxID=92724 RepID=UPI003CC93202